MTEEERRIIAGYVERVSGAAPLPVATPANSGGGGGASSTQVARPNLPPVDPEADRLIVDLFARHPEARYRITQTAFVQEAALVQAQNRIQDLEWQLENVNNQAQASQQSRGGFLGSMFGGGNRQQVPQTPRPEPIQTPPGGMNPAMMQQQGRGGSGFLGTALTTAAGVAGGMVLGNMMMGMFSGGAAEAATSVSNAASSAAGAFGEQGVSTPASSPWTNPGGNDAASFEEAGSFDEEA